MCACVGEREREKREIVCVCVCEEESLCVSVRARVCVFVRGKESVCERVCLSCCVCAIAILPCIFRWILGMPMHAPRLSQFTESLSHSPSLSVGGWLYSWRSQCTVVFDHTLRKPVARRKWEGTPRVSAGSSPPPKSTQVLSAGCSPIYRNQKPAPLQSSLVRMCQTTYESVCICMYGPMCVFV